MKKFFAISYRTLLFSIILGSSLLITTGNYSSKDINAQIPDSLTIEKSVNKLHVQRDAPYANEQDVTYTLTVNTDGYCNKPLDFSLAFDRSGSMGEPPENPPIEAAQGATASFINELDAATDRIALVSYNSAATLDEPITNNFSEVINTVNSFVAGGSTNIGDALLLSRNELVANSRSVDEIILIFTDGMWNSGPDPVPIADSIKNNDGIRIISVGIGTNVNTTFLETIASSPDDFYLVENLDDLEETFISIARDLQYGETEIVVTDDISQILENADFISATDGGYLVGNTLIWNLGVDPCNDTVSTQFTVRVRADAPDLSELINSATARDTSSALEATSQEVKTLVHAPNLVMVKDSGWEQVTPGSEIEYSINVRNTGTGNAYGVSIVDNLPASYFQIYENTISDRGELIGNSVIWNNNGIGFIFDGSFFPASSGQSLGNNHTFHYKGKVSDNTPIGQNLRNTVILTTNRNFTIQSSDVTPVAHVLAATGDPLLILKMLSGIFIITAVLILKRR